MSTREDLFTGWGFYIFVISLKYNIYHILKRRCVFFKKLLKAIVKILVIIAVIIIVIAAIVLSGGTALAFLIPLGLTAMQFLIVGLAIMAVSFMLDADTASETLGKAVTGIKETVSSVVEGGVELIGEASASIITKLWWLIPIGLGYYYISKDDNPSKVEVITGTNGGTDDY